MSTMSYFTPTSQVEKTPRWPKACEIQPSNLATMSTLQSMEAQQNGRSFLGAPILIPFGNSDLNAQLAYSTPKGMMLENAPSLRSMGTQGIQSSRDAFSDINLANVTSNYEQLAALSRLKRKMVCQDDITQNSTSWSTFVDDGRYSSSSSAPSGQGYTLYDRRYQAIGLPLDPHLRIFNATNGDSNI